MAQQTFPGAMPEFFGMGAVVGQAKQAEDVATVRLEASSSEPAPIATPTRRRAVRRPRS